MGIARKISTLFRRPSNENEVKNYSMENGMLVLEGVITCFNGKHTIPIRSFTSHELVTATENFSQPFTFLGWHESYGGSFEQRPILVAKFRGGHITGTELRDEAIRDIVVTSQMSIHGNVLKLLGCCLEYPIPALVYEYPPRAQRLSRLLRGSDEDSPPPPLTWRRRLKIANDIANVILYLHSAFATPIIYRNFKPSNVMIDQNGVAKLFDFSLSISLPPGESQVEDEVCGTIGYVDPEYLQTGFVSEKSDVYSFGVLLLVLLTGKQAYSHLPDNEKYISVVAFAHNEHQLDEIVDVKILGKEGGGIEHRQQLQSFLSLTLACIKYMGGDRPQMLDVARELRRIMRSHTSPNQLN